MMYKKFEDISKFRWWCHKVLPLVYDDSLSYYELLCKIMKKLDELIDRMNEFDVSELYCLIQSIMEMTAGGVYDFETDGNYDTTKEYVKGDYVIYENKLLKCIENTTGEFVPTNWIEVNIGATLSYIQNQIAPIFDPNLPYSRSDVVRYSPDTSGIEYLYRAKDYLEPNDFDENNWEVITISDVIFDYSTFKRNIYWSTFKSFDNDNKPYSEYVDEISAEAFAEFDITNTGEYAWDNFMNDCDLFPLNSIMRNCKMNDGDLSNKPPFENNPTMRFTVITIGDTSVGGTPLATSVNCMFDNWVGNAIQYAIPVDGVIGTPVIMWRFRPYSQIWSDWWEIGGGSEPVDNLDSVIGATVHSYDSAHTYYTGDFCTYNSGNGVEMFKAIDTTTGTFDSTKWVQTNIINELGNTIIREPATTFNQSIGAIGNEVNT